MPIPPPVVAVADPLLSARIVARRPLVYDDGADPSLDRPAHARAASSLVRLGDRLAAIQDDANFIAVINLDAWGVAPLTLPAGHAGMRQFDDTRGTKGFKLDLEAAVVIEGPDGPRMLAFGSGSTAARERIVIVDQVTAAAPVIRLVDAGALYARLRSTTTFSGSELNIEGAAIVGPSLRLFQRGNGAPSQALKPLDATCDLNLTALIAYLESPRVFPPPLPEGIMQYDLGTIEGSRLTFTDATPCPGGLLYSAAAEDSPDAVRDGPVVGSAVGVLAGGGGPPRYAVITEADSRFDGKVEGLALDKASPSRLLLVVDRDDPGAPSELCELVLEGPWFTP